MLLFFLIMSIVFTIFVFSIDYFLNNNIIINALIKSIIFLLLSIGLSFLMEKLLNPYNNYIPPQKTDSINDEDLDEDQGRELTPEEILKRSVGKTNKVTDFIKDNLNKVFDFFTETFKFNS